MAHCIAQTADGAFQFAYAGDPGWHGLGQKVTQGAAVGDDLPGVHGTGWGYLNAITEFADHKVRATSDDNRTVSAMFGAGDALKAQARDLLLAV